MGRLARLTAWFTSNRYYDLVFAREAERPSVLAMLPPVRRWRRKPARRRSSHLFAESLEQRQLSTAVRPGGTLVYSVATVTVCETLDVVTGFLASHPEFRLDPFPHPLEETTTPGTLQLWPHLTDSEARFMARMVRVKKP